RDIIAGQKLGTITAITLRIVSGANLKTDSVSWREDVELSGRQILAMGIWAETLNAWLGEYETLSASFATPIPRKTHNGASVEIGIPQVVQIQGRLTNGALISEYHTGVAVDTDSRGDMLTVHGLKGTLRYKLAGGTG